MLDARSGPWDTACMTKTTARQVVRAHRTVTTRTARAVQALDRGTARGWMLSGVRRAQRKAKRSMCEYFGVGEPVPAVYVHTLHTELTRDRVQTHFSTKGL